MYNKEFIQSFFLYCQMLETMYMDWKNCWTRFLLSEKLDEHLPF